jgi:hypothetical protein
MRILLVLLGAAEFPRRADLSSPTFAASSVAVRDWLLDKTHGPMVEGEDYLNLFDSTSSWPDQEAALADWLKGRMATQPPPTDLIVHYVGHGGFRDESRDYYLAIRATRAENPFYSSIMVDSLWRALRSGARQQRRFLIIDACFAAAAVRTLMAPLEEAVKVKVRAMQDVEGTQAARDMVVLPDRGTAVLCSSSAQDPANMAGTGGVTQFTDGLMQVLRAGSAAIKDRISLAQVHALVKASLSARYGENAVTPELHAPDQRLGLPQDVPLFPNLAPEEPDAQAEQDVQSDTAGKTAPERTVPKSPQPEKKWIRGTNIGRIWLPGGMIRLRISAQSHCPPHVICRDSQLRWTILIQFSFMNSNVALLSAETSRGSPPDRKIIEELVKTVRVNLSECRRIWWEYREFYGRRLPGGSCCLNRQLVEDGQIISAIYDPASDFTMLAMRWHESRFAHSAGEINRE